MATATRRRTTTRRPKAETTPDEPAAPEGEPAAPEGEPPPDGDGGDGGDLAEKVEGFVRDALGKLIGKGEVTLTDTEEEKEPEEPAKPTRVADIEADFEEQVRRAAAKLSAEEKHSHEHEEFKKVLEAPPKAV